MNFNDLLRRADLYSLETFLLYGSETLVFPPEKSFEQRLQDARREAAAFFKARYTDIGEYDEISGYFNKQVEAHQDVYFEIGLILGAKIALQLGKKLQELS